MQLSEHFSLEELTASEVAARMGIDNTPSPEIIENLRRLARFLEGVRNVLGGRPIHINSGYRSPALNSAVRGTKSSAHMTGRAADIVCPSFGTPLEICKAIRDSELAFDQVIFEFSSWCHYAIVHDGLVGRRECLTIDGAGTRMGLG
jgi:zinc D-Ala-D-Ala carboxypeptidase